MSSPEQRVGDRLGDSGRPKGQRARVQQLLARLSRVFGSSTAETLDAAVSEALELLAQPTEADVAFALLADGDERITEDWRWVRPGRSAPPEYAGRGLAETFRSSIEFLRLGHIVAVDDLEPIELSPLERELIGANDLRAILLAPVRVSSTLLGVVGLQFLDTPHHWTSLDLSQTELMAQLLAQTVQRTRDRGALALADARARRIAEHLPDGLVLVQRGGIISWVAPSFSRATGRTAASLVETPLVELVYPDDAPLLADVVADRPGTGGEATVRLLTEGWRWHHVGWTLSRDDHPGVPEELVVSFRDVHDRYLQVQQLAHESRRDELTGALNRIGLNEALATAIENRRRLFVVFVDADGLKALNDARGHDAGDDALRTLSAALRDAVRSTDHLARIGGDEFCLVIDADGHDDAAEALAARVVGEVRAVLSSTGITVSVGIAGPGPANTADQLRNAADQAMYEAKRAGGDRYAVAAPPPL